jgi:S1-C subfamily serine protease
MTRQCRWALLVFTMGLLMVLAACSSSGPSVSLSPTTSAARAATTAPTSAPGSASTATSSGSGSTASNGKSPAAALQDDFVRVISAARPSVVEVATDAGLGSGVVYDTSGHIVTNAHVVGDATQFRVTLSNGRIVNATLVGSYPPSDLAVIKLGEGVLIKPLSMADSNAVRVGDISIAIGNPLGLASSVTEGIVSSVGRTVSEGQGVVLPSVIQTSAPINPGNSGGALVNIDGALIGIPTLAAINPEMGSAAVGIGFAIPSNTVKFIADQLIKDGKVTQSGRAALGVIASDVVDDNGNPAGVLVRDLPANSPAAKAGVKVGDLIVSIDGKPTPDTSTLTEQLAAHQPGDTVKVEVQHQDGSTETVAVTLNELAA